MSENIPGGITAMRNERDDKDETTADFDHVSDMAARLKLKGRERDKYIHNHMTGLGYQMVPSYIKPDDDDDGGSKFSFGRSRSSSRGSRDDDDDYPF
jgi:hypothetical protein